LLLLLLLFHKVSLVTVKEWLFTPPLILLASAHAC